MRPLTQAEILGVLGGGVASHRVALLVKERGIDFEPTDDYINRVRLLGGDGELVSALKNAKPDSRYQRCARLREAGAELENKGESSAASQKYREAEFECRAAVAEGGLPYPSVVHFELGELLVAQKRWDGAIAEYREAMSLEGEEDSDCHRGIGEALEGKGDLDGAIAEYRQALQSFASSSAEVGGEMWRQIDNRHLNEIHIFLGLALRKKGDIAGAVGEGREWVRLTPAEVSAHEFLGSVLEQAGDLPAALEGFRTASQLDPNDSDAREGVARVEVKISSRDSIKMWRDEIRRSPDDLAAHELLAMNLDLSGDLDGAIAEDREIINRKLGKEYSVRCNLGFLLVRKGDIDGAIAEYRGALRQEPNYEDGHLGLCRALDQKGELDAAIAECREAVRLGPHSDNTHAALANILFRKRDIDGAIAEYREANRLMPGSPKTDTSPAFPGHHTELGNVLTWKGDWKGAADEFREAIRLDPDDDAAHYGLGMALEHEGDRHSALAEYQKACQLDSGNSTYQSALERLSKEFTK